MLKTPKINNFKFYQTIYLLKDLVSNLLKRNAKRLCADR
jgi:hypothetical protein